MASARMTEVYEKLYKAVCNQSTNNVITVANEIFHKPIMFVDEYFHVVSMHPAGPIGRPQWDAIYENKALNREQILRTLDEFLSGKKAFYKPFYAATGSCEKAKTSASATRASVTASFPASKQPVSRLQES